MTKEEIIEMARQAGFEGCAELTWENVICTEELEAFAKLVAEKAIKDALAQTQEQEPVGQLLEDAFGRGQVMWFNKPKDESMLYTTQPQRTWVGLTDEEIKAFDTWHDNREEEVGWCNPTEIVAYIEAKLKDKNTRGQE